MTQKLANQLTLGRIIFLPLCIIFLMYGMNGLAAITYLLLLFSDALDWYFAGRFGHESEIGKWLDPLADKVLIVSTLVILTGLARVNPIPVVIICSRELIVASLRLESNFAASEIAKYKTFFQGAATLMLILNLPFGTLVLWFSILLSLISGAVYLWKSRINHQI